MTRRRIWYVAIGGAVSLVMSIMTGCSLTPQDGAADAEKAFFAVNSTSKGAVYVDGRMVGETSTMLDCIEPGLRNIEVVDGVLNTIFQGVHEVKSCEVSELYTEEPDFVSLSEDEYILDDLDSDPKRLTSSQAAKKATDIVNTALGLKGIARYASKYSPPYWFDCCGFTYYCFKENGIDLGTKDDDKQALLGTYVSRTSLKKGDLVFFWSTKSGPGDIGHVGIYMGYDQFVHIFKPGETVAVSKLMGSTWWREHYMTARRVIK